MDKKKFTKDQLVEMVLKERSEVSRLTDEVERLAPFENKYKICKEAREDEKELRKLTLNKGKELNTIDTKMADLETKHKIEVNNLVVKSNQALEETQNYYVSQIKSLQKQISNQNGTIGDLFDLIDHEHNTNKLYFRKYKQVFMTLPPEGGNKEE